jgi:DNA polymerase (family 10)
LQLSSSPAECCGGTSSQCLRDVHARAAKEAGLKLVLNSDAHQIRAQGYVELAVAQARRGWLTKADVANTRTWKELDKLRKKRS